MTRKYTEPYVVTKNNGDMTITHPAYACISAHRTTGETQLYGSDFRHHSYISISIRPSEMHRSLSHDRHSPVMKDLIRIEMSEAQWATFISTMNVSEGTPCTLTRLTGSEVASIPPPAKEKHEQFSSETRKALLDVQARIEQVMAQLQGPVNKTTAARLHQELRVASEHLSGNVDFVAESFGKYVDESIEKAKIEVAAYTTSLVQRTGLTALQASQVTPPVELLLGENKDE